MKDWRGGSGRRGEGGGKPSGRAVFYASGFMSTKTPSSKATKAKPKLLIGMVHVGALPGTPRARLSVPQLAKEAAREAAILVKEGFRALLLENMHDAPYVAGGHGPEITAGMTAAALAIREAVGDVTMGIQVLARGEREALAVALAANCQFIRCENFVFSHVADEGLMVSASAGPLLRYRRQIGAEAVKIMCDLKKKHASHAITADVTLEDAIHATEFFGGEGVIVTGTATGKPVRIEDVRAARDASSLPVWVGSGVTPELIPTLVPLVDGLIVGSYLKKGGHWTGALDTKRCAQVVRAFERA